MDAHADAETQRFNSLSDRWFNARGFSLILAALIIAAFADVVFGWRTFFYRDFGIFGYPLAFHHRESFWQGEIPLWNPYNNSGIPFLAQWNSMVVYPFSLFYVLFPLSWSLGVFCLLHLFWAGLGMHRLVEHWSGHRLAACIAGVAFAFNGLTLSCLKWPNNIAALAWMPWIVLLAEHGWQRGGRWILWAALAGGVQLLTGGPEIILFTWLITGVLWLTAVIRRESKRENESDRSHTRLRIFIALPVIALLATALASVQLLPFIELLQHSQRSALYGDASWSMPRWGPANFLLPLFRCFPSHQGVFAQPGQYWISSYYTGVFVIVTAALALWLRRHELRVWVLATVAGVCLLLSLGPGGFLYSWLAEYVTPIRIIRFPIKFVVPVIFILPILAGLAVAWMDRTRATTVRPLRNVLERRLPARHVAHPLGGAGPEAGAPIPPVRWQHQRDVMTHQRLLIVGGVIGLAMMGAILLFGRSNPISIDQGSVHWQNALLRVGALLAGVGLFIAFIGQIRARTKILLATGLLIALWIDLMTQAPRLSPTIERWVFEPDLAKTKLSLNPAPHLGHSRAMLSPWADFRMNHLALTNAVDDYLYSRFSLFANVNLLDRIPKVDGFFSLTLEEENRVRYLLYASTNTARPPLQDLLSVSQITAPEKLIEWQPRTNFLSFATVGQTPVFLSGPDTLRALADAAFDPRKTVLLEPNSRTNTAVPAAFDESVKTNEFIDNRTHAVETTPLTLPSPLGGERVAGRLDEGSKLQQRPLNSELTNNLVEALMVSVINFRSSHVELEVTTAQPTWVVISQSYYHPWRACVNGTETTLHRANHAFQAVAVPAGKSKIDLAYKDRAFQIGACVSMAALAFCGAGLWQIRRNSTRTVSTL